MSTRRQAAVRDVRHSAPPRLREGLVASIPSLRAFAISLCNSGDRADDLVQETLVKAWRHRESFEPGTNLKAWLFTILRNTFFSECRKLQRAPQDASQDQVERLVVRPEQPGHVDLMELGEAMGRLPPGQREALILIGVEGFSYEEAARISGCEIGTIKSRVNRARIRLADLLKITEVDSPGPDLRLEAIAARAAPLADQD